LGADRSSLGDLIQQVAKLNGLTVAAEANPERGSFFRSDHFPFAKAGIPAVSLMSGQRFVGHSEAWVAEQRADYARRYHQPSDEYNPHWDLSGMVQQVRIATLIALRVANAEEPPQWLPGRAVAK
ncbi:MAG: M28 family peptidase, partial [Acidobacteria bacterium]|nr:M28 family peptidase [Acidobacteriota bacterium]